MKRYSNFQDILGDMIEAYCKKHEIQWFEINYKTKYVFYFTGDNSDYDSFNYLEVDLNS